MAEKENDKRVKELFTEGGASERELEQMEEVGELFRSTLDEAPSKRVMERLKNKAGAGVSKNPDSLWKRIWNFQFLVPALTTAIALVVWVGYGDIVGDKIVNQEAFEDRELSYEYDKAPEVVRRDRKQTVQKEMAKPESFYREKMSADLAEPSQMSRAVVSQTKTPHAPKPQMKAQQAKKLLPQPLQKSLVESKSKSRSTQLRAHTEEAPLSDEIVEPKDSPPLEASEREELKKMEATAGERVVAEKTMPQMSQMVSRPNICAARKRAYQDKKDEAAMYGQDDFSTLISTADCYEEEGNWKEAKGVYEAIKELYPSKTEFADKKISEFNQKQANEPLPVNTPQ